MSGIHHFVPVLHRGDAVGRHTLRLRDATGRTAIARRSSSTPWTRTADETVPVLSYAGSGLAGDVAVYQFATASAMAPWLAGRSETLVVNYHNVTPPELMAPWDNHLALGQLRAQGDLRCSHRGPRWPWPTRPTTRRTWPRPASPRTAVISPSAALDATGAGPAGAAGGAGATAPGDALAGRRAGLAQQGAREHHRRTRRRPRPRGRRGLAAGHRKAGDRFLCDRVAALRRRARAGRRGALRGPCRRRHRRSGVCRGPTCWS